MNSLIPELTLITFICIAIIINSLGVKFNKNILLNQSYLFLLAAVLAVNAIYCLFLIKNESSLNSIIDFNNVTIIFKIMTLAVGAICVLLYALYDYNNLPNKMWKEFIPKNSYLNQSLILAFCLLGSCLMIESKDFIIFYIAFEIQNFSLYVLTISKKDRFYSTEAGLKYFLIRRIASGLFLLGVVLLYATYGTINWLELNMLSLNLSWEENNTLIISLLLIMRSLLLKFPAAPLHNWAPDVYTGVSKNTLALFLTLPKFVLMGSLLNILYSAFLNLINIWSNILLIFGIRSIVVGSLGAYYQQNIRRFLAYGTIRHVGWILLGLSTASLMGTVYSLVYLLVYVITTFTILTILIKDNKIIQYIAHLYQSNFVGNNVTYGLVWSISLFSLGGIPPLAGFFVKFLILREMIKIGQFFSALIALIFSIIRVFYYIRIVRVLFFSTITTTKNIDILNRSILKLRKTTSVRYNIYRVIAISLISFGIIFNLIFPIYISEFCYKLRHLFAN